jgi:hypothetical protein
MRTNGPMGLSIWDSGGDFYSRLQLVANWDAVEGHDHTPGKGVQLGTNSLANNSVTGAKLAPNSINSSHIINKTIQGEDVGDHQIGLLQIDPSIFESITPLGTTIAWFRPNTSIAVPTGWVIANGQVVNEPNHGWVGAGSVAVPDLQNKFILGAATSGTGTGPTQPPAEKAVGGSHQRFFSHTHTVPGHSHSVDAHSHSLPFHSHTISVDGQHNHGIHSRQNAFLNGLLFQDYTGNQRQNTLQSLYIAGFNDGQGDAALPTVWPPNDGAHSHGARTGDSAGQTTADGAGTNSVGLTTDASSAGGDIRPAYVGLLYIVKVKHS